MRGTRHFWKNWAIISLAAFVTNSFLWWLMMCDDVLRACPYGWDDFVFDLSYCGLYVLVSLSVSGLIRRVLLDKRLLGDKPPAFSLFFLHSGAMLVTNIILAIAFESVVNAIYKGGEEIFWSRLYVFTTCATLLTIVYLCLYYSRIVIRQGSRNAEMQKELLKLQLDPHFVFNSLSTLTELISEDPELAETFTLKFSGIYRYIVNQLNRETVTIADEIRFIDDYCALLDIRHPHHFVFDIDDALRRDNRLILPMSIQILVENAVKHNCHSARQPLRIVIGREGGYVVVSNRRQPLKASLTSTNKVGLKNLSERYALLGLKPIVTADADRFEVRVPSIGKATAPLNEMP